MACLSLLRHVTLHFFRHPQEVDDSVDRIVAGMEGTPMVDGKSKSLVAYHEVGHAVCATLTPGHDPVQKVLLT